MNKLTINVTYGDKNNIFTCSKQNFVSQVKNYFHLNGEIELYKVYKGMKTKIEPASIRDLMAIEVKLKRLATRSVLNGQKFLEDYEIGESSKSLTKTEILLKKLLENKTLTGIERKNVIAMIQNRSCSSRPTLKRKRDTDDAPKKVPMVHKKLQVSMPFVKDSCAQTEPTEHQNLNDSTMKEDCFSLMRRMAFLENIDKTVVTRLMQKTFSERRNFILSKSPPVRLIREKYPLLFSFEEVKNEVDRIFNFGKCDEFLGNIDKHADAIFHNASKENIIYKWAVRRIEKAHSELQSKYARKVGALLLLPHALEEEVDFVVLMNQNHTPHVYPYIDASTLELKELFQDCVVYRIVVETTTLCVAQTFPEAVLCLVACFYIFNISYTPQSFRTFVAMEKLFLAGNETDEIDSYTSQMIKYFKLKTKC